MTALQDETFVRVKRLTVAMQCKGCYNLSGFFKYCRISCSDFQKKALALGLKSFLFGHFTALHAK